MTQAFEVSVVIPVFNGERFLAEAIESLQAPPDTQVEVIVVDDGSTDGTAAVAAGFGDRVRLLRQSNQGPAAARNHGIRSAQGDVLAFLDADDLFSAAKLTLQLERLRRHPDVGIVLGQPRYFSTSDLPESFHPAEPNPAAEHLFLSFGCSLVRRSVFDAIGLLDETMRFCEDWDWFMRAREAQIRFLIHRDVVLHSRLHDRNLTRQREAGKKFVLEMFRRSLARRKTGQSAPPSLAPLSTFLEPAEVTP